MYDRRFTRRWQPLVQPVADRFESGQWPGVRHGQLVLFGPALELAFKIALRPANAFEVRALPLHGVELGERID